MCRGIVCWRKKNIAFFETKIATYVSLQAGDTSLLHLILHFRTRMHNAKIHATHDRKMVPFKGKFDFLRTPNILQETVIFCQGQWKRSCNYSKDMQVCVTIVFPELCVLTFMIYDPLPDDCDVVT